MRQLVKTAPLLLLAIPGLFFLLFSGTYVHSSADARAIAAKSQIDQLQSALGSYLLDTGQFPTEAQGLEALRTDPGVESWRGPYVQKGIPADPWGAPYVYRLIDGKPQIDDSHR